MEVTVPSRTLSISAILMLLSVTQASAQAVQPAPRPAAAPSTIMIATGDIDSTEARIVSEMARSLNDGAGLRVIPMIGQGSVQSVSDLLNIRSVDAAIIQYDVLSQFKKTQRIPLIQNKLQYISKLYSQEVHVLSRMQFTCLADLEGRRVNFGSKGSGAALTAEIMFGAHNVKPQPLYSDLVDAFDKLKRGEIDALVYVGGKPSPTFKNLKYTDRIHYLDVDYVDELQQDYLPAIMTHDDYPDLIAPDETVTTIAVSSVLVMAGHRSQSDQFRRLSVFSDKLFENMNKLRTKDYHEKWQEVNLTAPLSGWTRFPAAQTWIDLNAARLAKADANKAVATGAQTTLSAEPPGQNADKVRAMLKQFLETQGAGNQGDREELFNQFVRWYEKQSP